MNTVGILKQATLQLILMLLFFPMAALAQTTTPAGSPSSGGNELLTALQTAHGGPLSSVCGTGTITRAASGDASTATTVSYSFRACASVNAMRSDTSYPAGTWTRIYSHQVGIIRTPSGKHAKITGRNSILWRPIYFPPLLPAAYLADTQYSVSGLPANGQALPAFRMHRASLLNRSAGMPANADDTTISCDPSSGLIASFSWSQSLEAPGLQYLVTAESVSYSDYVQVSGYWLASTVTEMERGVTRSTIHFTSFEVNTTLPSDYFAMSLEETR